MKYTRLRGTQDIVPPEVNLWRAVEDAFTERFDRFGYDWIRTPIIERTDLFVRAVGEQSDIVTKEMYTFTDRGGRSITLRPENTASVIRAYLENGLHRRGGMQRLCYAGPMFRYDRPQAGRYRQFHQVGAEAIGSDNPAVDVEMIQLVVDSLRALGFDRLEVRVNSVGTETSRAEYRRKLLDAIRGIAGGIGAEAMERYTKNPLRIFDAKDVDDALKAKLPVVSDHLIGADAAHFASVRALLDETGVRYEHDPRLVRGLDYYTNTVFEVYAGARGAQSALCGGGRYDALVEECGGPPTPAIGFSAGLERIVAALPDPEAVLRRAPGGVEFYVVCADDAASALALRVAAALRVHGNTSCDLSRRSKKKQMQAAHRSGARFVVLAPSEGGRVEVHDLAQRAQHTVAAAELGAWIAARRELKKDTR